MLSRTHLTSKYGDFKRMMETRDAHGGFGEVTWNVGPHAGPNPYGKGFSIMHVSRNSIVAGRKAAAPDEEERHAQSIGQQMDRGDVIHVPHVRFKGGVPDIDPKHAAAIHAAGQRGAERIPVLVHKNDVLDLHALASDSGAQVYGAPGPGQGREPGIKYRWNGHGWYSKPSFNKGKCPQNSKADIGSDKCIGGGDAPAPDHGKRIPSALYGADSLPADRRKKNPAAPAVAPAAAAAPAAPPAAPAPAGPSRKIAPKSSALGASVVHQNLDRTPLRGQRAQVGQGLDMDLLYHRMDTSIGGRRLDPNGEKRKIKLEPEPGDSPEEIAAKKAIQDAAEAAARQDPSVKMGEFLGAGAAGAVFKGPEENGISTVYKVDQGAYEARMADAVIKAGLVGKNPSLPNYKKTFPTNVRAPNGYPLWVIHREDLADADKHLSTREMGAIGWYGGFGGWLSNEVANAGARGGRKAALSVFDNGIKQHRRKAAAAGGQYAQQFPRLEKDIRDLIKRGLAPCDLHEGNWGVRPATGEIVMRDVGCAHVMDS